MTYAHASHPHRWHPHPCLPSMARHTKQPKVTIDPALLQGDRMDKLKALLRSRKFWAAVIGLLLIVARNLWPQFLPFSDAQISEFLFVVIAYILGTALEDAGAAFAKR